ncbi:MAG: hypothetical protein A2987_02440 [Omnitrophica bacterium RIFCSPLOWO2_01_FULL_45_10]|nr:MAG: hypothetical protein A2987_02440 [Omnitrophica bacterium RIFCSPLOWO2_01_FULL_45_10]
MIQLDISALIFLYIFLSVIIILILWALIGYRTTKRFPPKEVDYLWKCSVCLNIYVDSKHENISRCPLCGSYNERSDMK